MTVTVYTKPACVQCRATYKALDDQGVPYRTVNLPEFPELAEAFREAGHMQAPVVVVERHGDTETWAGFRPDLIAGLVGEARG